MNNSNRQSFAKAANYKNYADKKKGTEKTTEKKPDNKVNNEVIEIRKPYTRVTPENTLSVSAERLQEAVIWAEILDKPLSKRRKRR